jgi:hypothetical protein
LAKVIVCVDGFNLYYGAPKSTPYNQRNSLKGLHGAGNRGGFPAFWCFRFAVVRRAGVPDNLIKVWKGHSQNLMDLYSAQLRHDVAYNIVASARLKHSQFFETQLRACTVGAQIALRKKRKGCRGAATLMNQLLEEMVAGVRFEPTTFGL